MALALRASGLSHVGVVRASNQDSAFIGNRLLVMADGMGGHAGGDIASATAVKRIRQLDADSQRGPDDLQDIIYTAQDDIIDRVEREPVLSGMGTTITSLILDSGEFTMAHIGDSRAYRLRGDEFEQISADHTFVQHLIDTGRLAPEDAEKHPQRSVLLRVLGDVEGPAVLDVTTFPAEAGERWLLCSDGLSGVVHDAELKSALAEISDRDACAQKLIDLAIAGGGPDNITCIIADIVEIEDDVSHPNQNVVLGSAATTEVAEDNATPDTAALRKDEPDSDEQEANTAGAKTTSADAANTAEVSTESAPEESTGSNAVASEEEDPDESQENLEEKPRSFLGRLFRGTLLLFFLLLIVAGAAWGGWKWTQNQWYIGSEGGKVAIFKGVPQDLGPLPLYEVSEISEIDVEDLNTYFRTRVAETLPAQDMEDARRILSNIREQTAP